MTSEHVQTFTDANFDAEVLQSELPVLVDFSADWCPPCLVMEPVIDRVAQDYARKLRVGTVDVEANGESSTRYEIHHLPTLLVFRSGRVVARIVGAVHRAKLDTLLAAVI
jgi:thioredoxin 1